MKVNHHQEVNQNDRKHQSQAKPDERVLHRQYLAAKINETAARQLAFSFLYQTVNLIGDIAEIFTVYIGIDINHRPDIVVIDNRTGLASRDLGHIPKNLKRSRVTSQDRQVAQGI